MNTTELIAASSHLTEYKLAHVQAESCELADLTSKWRRTPDVSPTGRVAEATPPVVFSFCIHHSEFPPYTHCSRISFNCIQSSSVK